MVRQERKRHDAGTLPRRGHWPHRSLVHAVTIPLLGLITTLSVIDPIRANAQPSDDVAALKELVESAPPPSEVKTEPSSSAETDYRHRLLLNRIPGLPGEIQFSAKLSKGNSVRALITLDGKLLALPLKADKTSGEYRGSFPTPYHTLDYQFQILSPNGATLSQIYRAAPQCASITETDERFPGELELVKQIRLLRNDTALLTATIQQIEVILGK